MTAGLLWIVAAFMELAAVTAYYLTGLGVAFWLLEIFVLLTFALTFVSINMKGDREHSHLTR